MALAQQLWNLFGAFLGVACALAVIWGFRAK
jgi:hypothetical protein